MSFIFYCILICFLLTGELKLFYSLPPDYLIDSHLAYDVSSYPKIYMNTDFGLLEYNALTKVERIIGGNNSIKKHRRNSSPLCNWEKRMPIVLHWHYPSESYSAH